MEKVAENLGPKIVQLIEQEFKQQPKPKEEDVKKQNVSECEDMCFCFGFVVVVVALFFGLCFMVGEDNKLFVYKENLKQNEMINATNVMLQDLHTLTKSHQNSINVTMMSEFILKSVSDFALQSEKQHLKTHGLFFLGFMALLVFSLLLGREIEKTRVTYSKCGPPIVYNLKNIVANGPKAQLYSNVFSNASFENVIFSDHGNGHFSIIPVTQRTTPVKLVKNPDTKEAWVKQQYFASAGTVCSMSPKQWQTDSSFDGRFDIYYIDV